MESLPTGDQLSSTEEQVERVGKLRSLRFRVSIEWPFTHWIACDKEELAVILLLCPFTEPTLVLWREVRLASHICSVAIENEFLRFREVDMRYQFRNSRYLYMRQLQLACILFAKSFQDLSNHVTQERHDCKVVLNKSKLNIEADIFVDMASCVVWFCTEDWTHLEDTLKDSHHNLLIELGTLRQVCISPEVVKFEDIGPTFCCRCNDLWRLYLSKISFSQD